MKPLFAALLLAVTAALAASGLAGQVAVGQVAPNFKFEKTWNGDEGLDELTDYRGKLVIVEAWATW